MNPPKISICVPTFQRVNFLKRLLESIAVQVYRDFEVIVTDDSPGSEVQALCEQYNGNFIIHYIKNPNTLGTPANWNQAIKHARGEWIKLMHDDDWFSSPNSLKIFVEKITPQYKFISSGYSRIYDNNIKAPEKIISSSSKNKAVEKQPALLFANNIIGPPSVTLVHHSVDLKYDETLKWRVDIDFYIRVLAQEHKFIYIDQLLINVGMSASQITQSSINDPAVELPEGWIMLQKHGLQPLRNIRIYDAWWRLFRNMNIQTQKDLMLYFNEQWPAVILEMLSDLRRTPRVLLNSGVTSKLCMSLSYLKNRSLIK
jgi:glycosyltransferase involved in cell wall biosynthesis